MSSLFISHNHRDKPFVRRLGSDLGALGVRVWIDEAEIKVGESLISKITTAIDEMQFLGVVLSPNSVTSNWVQEELNQAMDFQIKNKTVKVLPLLLIDCDSPGFLRTKLYADFRYEQEYHSSLERLLITMGVDTKNPSEATLHDPFASRYKRVSTMFARPKVWHCIFCGWRCESTINDYMCMNYHSLRPFAGDSATRILCETCGQWSLGCASFCEWCGHKFRD